MQSFKSYASDKVWELVYNGLNIQKISSHLRLLIISISTLLAHSHKIKNNMFINKIVDYLKTKGIYVYLNKIIQEPEIWVF